MAKSCGFEPVFTRIVGVFISVFLLLGDGFPATVVLRDTSRPVFLNTQLAGLPGAMFAEQALSAIALDGRWMSILRHVPNPVRSLQGYRPQGGGRVAGKIIPLRIAAARGRVIEAPPVEERGAVDRFIIDGISRYYSRHPQASRRKITFALVDTTGFPNAARAYKKPGLLFSKIVLDKAEMETLARYYAEGGQADFRAARWLLDLRLGHELSHSNRILGNPIAVIGGLFSIISGIFIQRLHGNPQNVEFVMRLGVLASLSFLTFAIGGYLMTRDELEENRLIARDAGRHKNLFDESKRDYWEVRQLLEKEPALSSLKAYFMTFEQLDHPSTLEQGRKSWSDFFARTDGARWWPGVRTMPAPHSNNRTNATSIHMAIVEANRLFKHGQIYPAIILLEELITDLEKAGRDFDLLKDKWNQRYPTDLQVALTDENASTLTAYARLLLESLRSNPNSKPVIKSPEDPKLDPIEWSILEGLQQNRETERAAKSSERPGPPPLDCLMEQFEAQRLARTMSHEFKVQVANDPLLRRATHGQLEITIHLKGEYPDVDHVLEEIVKQYPGLEALSFMWNLRIDGKSVDRIIDTVLPGQHIKIVRSKKNPIWPLLVAAFSMLIFVMPLPQLLWPGKYVDASFVSPAIFVLENIRAPKLHSPNSQSTPVLRAA